MGNVHGDQKNGSIFSEQEIKRLYRQFQKLDKDGNGMLESEEFFEVPELAQNPMIKRVFRIFDKNKDNSISFVEFIQGLSKLSENSNDEEKLRFAFKIYDMDEDGFISNGDLFKILKIMIGNNLTDVQLQQLVDRTIIQSDYDQDGLISYEEFVRSIKEQNLLSKITLRYD